jgi:uncharacterized membrane protein YhfC
MGSIIILLLLVIAVLIGVIYILQKKYNVSVKEKIVTFIVHKFMNKQG